LRVESVAWVSERKDVLNGLFTFGSVFSYIRYAHLKGNSSGNMKYIGWYSTTLALFMFSLMTKSITVVLPVLLLVMDWFPLGRFKAGRTLPLFLEKVPFLLLSSVATVLTVYAGSQAGWLTKTEDFSLWSRILVSGHALFEYVRLMLFPFNISPIYIIPVPIPSAYTVKTVVVLAAFSILVIVGRKMKAVNAVMLSFLIPLLPVLPMLQGDPTALAVHNTYLASVGISIAAASAIVKAIRASWGGARRYLAVAFSLLITVLLGYYVIATQRQIEVWRNSETMWSRVIDYQPFDRAYFTRGLFYVDMGRYDDAIRDYSICLNIMTQERMPEFFNIFAFRGEAFAKARRYQEAVNDFDEAIRFKPHPLYYYHRGQALQRLGRQTEAKEDLLRSGRARGQITWITP
jgi:protein O-mannosyl-transferase